MIIVLGSIGIQIKLAGDTPDNMSFNIRPEDTSIYVGGKGANQALAAARSGASASLVSKVGKSYWHDFLVERLRKDGIKVSGIARSEDCETGLWVEVNHLGGPTMSFNAPSAALEITASQIPTESMNERSLLLVQTEVPFAENLEALQQAKKAGAHTMMNLSPSLEISPEMLQQLDYLVVNTQEAQQIAQQLGIEGGTPPKIAQALAILGSLTCIITQGAEGAIAVETNLQAWEIGALPLDEVVDKTGAEDVYCGTLAACIQAGVEFPMALKRASVAATLACKEKGNHESYPYLDDIDNALDDLADARALTL